MLPHVVEIGDNLADVPVKSQLFLNAITVIKLFAGVTLYFCTFTVLTGPKTPHCTVNIVWNKHALKT